MTKLKPNFYAVIPANVRYARIKPNAKLLYGEITALCSKEGFCWAGNSYFADLYKVSRKSVERWLFELRCIGVIQIEGNTKKRTIRLGTKMSQTTDKNVARTTDKNVHDINTDDINTKELALASPSASGNGYFNLKEEIEKYKKSPQRHIQLIGEYLEERNVRLETKEQFKRATSRHMRAARALADFSDKQIGAATRQAQNEYPAIWTLDTLIKILTK